MKLHLLPFLPTMTNELNLDNQLSVGDIVGDTKRIVIAKTKLAERVPGDSYAYWVAICYKEEQHHPYVVWRIIARPEGFVAEQGDYYFSLTDAVKKYEQRGGQVDYYTYTKSTSN
jgi:hypothetical protein